jgi:hypothetical protein
VISKEGVERLTDKKIGAYCHTPKQYKAKLVSRKKDWVVG